MLTLRELQTGFCDSVAGDVPDELLRLIAGDGFDPAARLSIYRNNVVTRLTDTLSAAYPVVCQLVDRRFFEFAADRFLRRHLPANGCLSEYGEDFSTFLAEFPPAAELKYLEDVARLEWAIHEVRHASATAPIGIEALAAVKGDPSIIKLRLVPAVRFIASPHAIDQIWIAHQPESSSAELRLGNSGVRLQVDGTKGLAIAHLSPSTWEFRARLAANETLGTAIAAALAVAGDFDPPSALAALFSDDFVVGLT